jgi:hypothetical protein
MRGVNIAGEICSEKINTNYNTEGLRIISIQSRRKSFLFQLLGIWQ